MGGTVSHFFQSGSALLTAGNHRGCSDATRARVRTVFDALRANPRVNSQRLDGLLSQIPKSDNVLVVHNEEGYNLLQKVVAINNVDMLRWLLSRSPDLNRGACSFPLHIACLRGHEDCVELLLKHGGRVDVEARMCWPGPHNPNCEERGKYCIEDHLCADRSSDKLQSAICYAIDGDQVDILELLMQQTEEHWLPWQQKRPLLHVACERGAWNCVKYLVSERSEEINQCYDEYYPIHQAALQPSKFLEILIQNGADINVCTQTEQLTLLHLVFLLGRKSTEDTLNTCKLLLDSGLREMINRPDSLGNTPLHGLIVRYALEEARYPYDSDIQPWNKWDVLHIARYLLKNGASPSINQPGNSALACVLRHVRDWEFRYEMLNMLLQEGGDPNIVGRDGSVPLMVCLVPLINKDPLHHLSHTMKVCYLNCVRILLKHGANPNCTSRSNLTPLHVLVFSASETMALGRDADHNMEFIRSLLVLLLQHGLDIDIRISARTQHILLALMDMAQSMRHPADLHHVYDLTLTFLQYGANPDQSMPVGPRGPKGEASPAASAFYRAAGSCQPVVFHYAMTVSQKQEFMSDPEGRFATIVYLFYLSMSHRPLYAVLRALLCAVEAGVIPVRATALFSLVKELAARPRSLKQLARLTIYHSLERRPGLTVSKLPLPNSLKDYLLNFDP